MPGTDIDALLARGKDLLISISGVRGVVPQGLDPVNVVHFARAFAAISGKRIVLGEDARPTGPALRDLWIGTLLAGGKDALECGLAPTPTVKAAVNLHKADGGVMISASHNPLPWNGFKFMQKGGFFFDAKSFAKGDAALREDRFPAQDYRRFGRREQIDAVGEHVRAVLKALPNVAQIRKKKYTVLVDAVAGAGREALPMLLEELGCKVVRLYCDASPGGVFPRPPEPTPVALKEFSKLLKKNKVHVGFALDPDADRLVCGSSGRGAINEEYTLPLAFLGLAPGLSENKAKRPTKIGVKPGKVMVVNLSTAALLDRAAAQFGMRVERAPVGEANVVGLMRKRKAVFGGEGNGGVIHPGVPSYGRDSLIGAGLTLSAMARQGARNLDDLLEPLGDLHMQKTKMEIPGGGTATSGAESIEQIFLRMTDRFSAHKPQTDRRDGLHLKFQDGSWLHVRASNTEPVLRCIGEAPDPATLRELMQTARDALA